MLEGEQLPICNTVLKLIPNQEVYPFENVSRFSLTFFQSDVLNRPPRLTPLMSRALDFESIPGTLLIKGDLKAVVPEGIDYEKLLRERDWSEKALPGLPMVLVFELCPKNLLQLDMLNQYKLAIRFAGIDHFLPCIGDEDLALAKQRIEEQGESILSTTFPKNYQEGVMSPLPSVAIGMSFLSMAIRENDNESREPHRDTPPNQPRGNKVLVSSR